MLKNIIAPAFLLILVCSNSFAALAQSSGSYIDVGIGSNIDFNLAGTIDIGYKINDFFTAEIGSATYSNGDGNNYLFDFAVKGIFPFSNGFNIFAKLGGAEAHGPGGFKPVVYYGAGIGYTFTPNVTGDIQWNATSSNKGVFAPDLMFIGINYSF